MSKLEKLIEKMRRLPPEANYEDVVQVLIAYGFEEERSSGSHHVFRHKDKRTITVPKVGGQKVKRIYIKQILKLIEEV